MEVPKLPEGAGWTAAGSNGWDALVPCSSERVVAGQFHQLDLGNFDGGSIVLEGPGAEMGGCAVQRKGGFSDACAREGTVLGEDDDASLAGDVAFHEILLTASE